MSARLDFSSGGGVKLFWGITKTCSDEFLHDRLNVCHPSTIVALKPCESALKDELTPRGGVVSSEWWQRNFFWQCSKALANKLCFVVQRSSTQTVRTLNAFLNKNNRLIILTRSQTGTIGSAQPLGVVWSDWEKIPRSYFTLMKSGISQLWLCYLSGLFIFWMDRPFCSSADNRDAPTERPISLAPIGREPLLKWYFRPNSKLCSKFALF